ncbi:MAG: DUF359 domain-containing protein [Candidatus Peribacteraceae bacterium]|nr:DUF359 domain-containing protein [Candidatus Peribacteraceae bacterium]
MIIAISGTPGTGKTAVAKELAKKLGWWSVSLNDIAEEEGLYAGHDDERLCKVVDIEAMKREVNVLSISHRKMIIESHYAHDMPCDVVIILRTEPSELRKRMKEKGFHERKIRENLEAEIMNVIKDEACEKHQNIYEIDTTEKDPLDIAITIRDLISNQPFLKKDVVLPEKFIMEFRRPFGKLIKGADFEETSKKAIDIIKENSITVTVGDPTTYFIDKNGLSPTIAIVDGMEKKKKFPLKIRFKGEKVKVENPKGHITVDLWKAVEKAISIAPDKSTMIQVEGEEDLAVLPCIVHLPIGSYILYGQFDEGLVFVEVDEKKKQRAKALIENILFSQ